MILAAIIAGLAAGIFGSLVGLGGGVIIVPALALVFGLPLTDAIPASLVGVVATAIGGTAMYLREGHTDVPLALRAACLTVIGAVIGATVAVRVPERVLEFGFSAMLFLIVWRMVQQKAHPEEQNVPEASMSKAVGLFVGSGVVAGLLGVGGGVLNVPAIRLALRRSMIVAVATSTMIIAFTAGAGAATFAAAGFMKWPLATGCATGAFVGGRLGAWLAPRLPRKALQTIFVGVLLYVAVEFAMRGFGLPWWR